VTLTAISIINLRNIKSLFLILLIIKSYSVDARKIIFASSEKVPYIGEKLKDGGYVSEVIIQSLKRVGHQVEIQFFPQARALHMALMGKVDGLLPTHYDKSLIETFTYSSPFPGNNFGLLKRKTLSLDTKTKEINNIKDFLNHLKGHKFGLVRGSSIMSSFNNVEIDKELVTSDIQNIDKLNAGYINFAVIDKYTAADLITNQRPHIIGHLDFSGPIFKEKAFHVAFSKKRKHIKLNLKDFNKGLQLLKNDGTLNRIRAKHGLLRKSRVKGRKIITIGTVVNNDMITLKKISENYLAKHPNIDIEWRILDENILRQRLLSDLAIEDGQFDIMTIGLYEAPIWAKKKWIIPFENIPKSYDINDVIDSVQEGLSYKGQQYALPFYAESSMTYYRKDLFKKHDLTMPINPTYIEIKNAATKIHDPSRGIYGIFLRGKFGWGENIAYLSTLVNTYGGQWFDTDWKPLINSQQWINAVQMYKDLITNYGPPNPEKNGYNENRKLFKDGQCGIWIDATVAASSIFDNKNNTVEDTFGFAQAPIAITTKGSSWLWSWALAIPNSSLNKREAEDFIYWATSKKYIQTIKNKNGWISIPPGTRKSVYSNKQYQKAAQFSKFVFDAISSADVQDSTLNKKPYRGIQYAGISEFPSIGNNVSKIIIQIISGEMTVKDGLNKAQREAEIQMMKSGYYKTKK
jgi:sorbitol/mannitol transport system substrate-binding protein